MNRIFTTYSVGCSVEIRKIGRLSVLLGNWGEVLPGDAGGDNSGGGAMLDAGAETLFVGRSEDNEAGGGTILGAGVEAHGSAEGAVPEKKNQKQNYMR